MYGVRPSMEVILVVVVDVDVVAEVDGGGGVAF